MLYVCSSDLACKAHVVLKRLGWCRDAAEDHKAKAKEVEHALQASLRDKEKQLKEAIKYLPNSIPHMPQLCFTSSPCSYKNGKPLCCRNLQLTLKRNGVNMCEIFGAKTARPRGVVSPPRGERREGGGSRPHRREGGGSRPHHREGGMCGPRAADNFHAARVCGWPAALNSGFSFGLLWRQ